MDLEKLSISLRDENFRRELDKQVIIDIINGFKLMNSKDQISGCKVLGNYVSEIKENSELVGSMIEEIIFNSGDIQLNYIQMITVSNILTTSPKSIGKFQLNLVFKKLIKIMECNLETSMDLIDDMVDLVEEGNSHILEITIEDFKTVYQTCGDCSLTLKLSGLIRENVQIEDDKIFKNVLSVMNNDQILLNISYCLNQPNLNTIESVFSKFKDNDNEDLRPSLMLIISNFITDVQRKEIVEEWLPNEFLIGYFKGYFETFEISKPWIFQSINLLNKIPLNKFDIDLNMIHNFVEKLRIICIKSIVQIRFEVISLQIDVLSKFLNEMTKRKDEKSRDEILEFVNTLFGIDSQLDRVLIRLRLNFLSFIKSDEEYYNYDHKDILMNTLKMIEFKDGKIESKDLSLLSKILGIYVKEFKNELWFKEIIQQCDELSLQDTDPNITIFLNNLKYTKMCL